MKTLLLPYMDRNLAARSAIVFFTVTGEKISFALPCQSGQLIVGGKQKMWKANLSTREVSY